MTINSLYETAKDYIKKIKTERPDYYSANSCLTLILNGSQELFAGTTGVKISGDSVETVHSEFNAITLINSGQKTNAVQMITVSFSDYSVCKPSTSCVELLLSTDTTNSSCEIAVSPQESVSAVDLISVSEFIFDESEADAIAKAEAEAAEKRAIEVKRREEELEALEKERKEIEKMKTNSITSKEEILKNSKKMKKTAKFGFFRRK